MKGLALLLLEQAVEQAVAVGYMFAHALRVVWLSEAYLCAGRLDEAYTQAQRALEFSRTHQERGHRGLGPLYLTLGQRAPAHAALSTAIDLYRTMDMTFWLPQAEAMLARVKD